MNVNRYRGGALKKYNISNVNLFSYSWSQLHGDITISMDLGNNIGTVCEAPKIIRFVSPFEYTLPLNIIMAMMAHVCSA